MKKKTKKKTARPARATKKKGRSAKDRAVDAFLARVYVLAARELRALEQLHAGGVEAGRAEHYRDAQRDLSRSYENYRRREDEPK